MEIKTNNWKEYEISDIFYTQKKGKSLQVPTGASVDKKNLTFGNIPRITVSGVNNGIFDYYKLVNNDPNYRVYENFISVSFLGTVFYQKGKASLDMKVHCLKPINITLNEYTGKFLATIILASLKESTYSDQISSTVLPNIKIKLPTTQDGLPDWQYMEKTMFEMESATSQRLNSLLLMVDNKNTNLVNTAEWKEFHLYDDYLFNIDSGSKLDKVKMNTSSEEIAFVGRSNANNGITTFVKKISDIIPYKKGNLTLALGGAYLGSCFVQPYDFYTSQNVVVLIPKVKMNNYVKWFIATTIFKESQNNYKAFIKELNAHIKKDFTIKLPVTSSGVPNWEYMNDYMLEIENKLCQILNIIRYQTDENVNEKI